MKSFLRNTIISALSIWLTGSLLGSMQFDSTSGLVITAIVLGFLNSTIKPVLKVLTFPVTFLTFGLFSLVVNAAVLYLAIQLSGQQIASFGAAIPAAVLITVLNGAFENIFSSKK
ncbi:MAG: phage holin family protein [Solobacterium sp.]|nr:phage holin family protein [Solobacterium sp.]